MTDARPPTNPLSALCGLRDHRSRWGIWHAAGSPIFDTAVRDLAALGVPLTPYQAIDAGLAPEKTS